MIQSQKATRRNENERVLNTAQPPEIAWPRATTVLVTTTSVQMSPNEEKLQLVFNVPSIPKWIMLFFTTWQLMCGSSPFSSSNLWPSSWCSLIQGWSLFFWEVPGPLQLRQAIANKKQNTDWSKFNQSYMSTLYFLFQAICIRLVCCSLIQGRTLSLRSLSLRSVQTSGLMRDAISVKHNKWSDWRQPACEILDWSKFNQSYMSTLYFLFQAICIRLVCCSLIQGRTLSLRSLSLRSVQTSGLMRDAISVKHNKWSDWRQPACEILCSAW